MKFSRLKSLETLFFRDALEKSDLKFKEKEIIYVKKNEILNVKKS